MNPILKKALLVAVLAGSSVIAKAQDGVGIGTRSPHASAVLEIQSTNKGLLIPRVALQRNDDATTIGNPANALLVFNTNAAMVNGNGPGFYYWDTNKWIAVGANVASKGIPGVDGKPGTNGVSVPGDTNIVVDKTTNIVYVKDENGNWIPLNGLDGKNGLPGVEGATGRPGMNNIVIDDQGNVWAYTGSSDDEATRNADWANNHTNYTKLNGLNGEQGIPGVPGEPGTPGATTITTLDAIIKTPSGDIYAYIGDKQTAAERNTEFNETPLTKWVKINGLDGRDGSVGMKGGDGKPGDPGTPGLDGIIEMYIDKTTGVVYVRDPEDRTKWVPLTSTIENNSVTTEKIAPGTNGQYLKTVVDPNDATKVITQWSDLLIPDNAIQAGDAYYILQSVPVDPADASKGTKTQWSKLESNSIKPGNDGEVLTTVGSGATATTQWKKLAGSNIEMNIVKTNANYTVLATDYTIVATGLTSNITITLPDATTCNGRVLVINQNSIGTDATPYDVTLSTPIKVSDTKSITKLSDGSISWMGYGSIKVTLQSDGVDWYAISYGK